MKFLITVNNLLFSKIEKPWGFEELIECNDKYVVKKLFMKKGHSSSIQYHELKTETIIVLSEAHIELIFIVESGHKINLNNHLIVV